MKEWGPEIQIHLVPFQVWMLALISFPRVFPPAGTVECRGNAHWGARDWPRDVWLGGILQCTGGCTDTLLAWFEGQCSEALACDWIMLYLQCMQIGSFRNVQCVLACFLVCQEDMNVLKFNNEKWIILLTFVSFTLNGWQFIIYIHISLFFGLFPEKPDQADGGWLSWVHLRRRKGAHSGPSIYLVRGKDRGRPAWHYVHVKDTLLTEFLEKTRGGSLDVADYGEVLSSGWGDDPPADLADSIDRDYA